MKYCLTSSFLFSERIVTTEKTVTEGPVTTKTGD